MWWNKGNAVKSRRLMQPTKDAKKPTERLSLKDSVMMTLSLLAFIISAVKAK